MGSATWSGPAGPLIGGIEADHLFLGTALVGMVGVGEPGPGASYGAGIGVGRHAEGLVPAELNLFEQDLDGFR